MTLPMTLQIQHHTVHDADADADDVLAVVVSVTGEVDTYTAAPLREQLTATTSQPSHLVVLDLSGVAFMDSAGLGVLVGALKRSRAQSGQIRLAGLQPMVARVMTVTGLITQFHSYPDAAAALRD